MVADVISWLNIWVLILTLSFTCCVTLAKLQNPSESQFHYLLNNINRGFPGGSVIKICLPMQKTWVQSPNWDDPAGSRTT